VIPNSQAASRRWLVAWKLVRRLPAPLAFGLGRVGGRVYHRLDRGRREALEANLAQVLGPGTPRQALARTVRRGFASYGRYWVEAFRLEDLTAASIRERLRIEGR
jgi:lauroyl/myristoyl acyltransferase